MEQVFAIIVIYISICLVCLCFLLFESPTHNVSVRKSHLLLWNVQQCHLPAAAAQPDYCKQFNTST